MMMKNDDNIILQTSFINESEQVILEFFKNQILINYISKNYTQGDLDTLKLIKNYIKKNETITVFGFELSLDVNRFNSSLESHINDKSTYPIILLKNQETEIFNSENEVNNAKLKILNTFINILNND